MVPTLIDDMFIDLIRNDIEIKLLCQLAQKFEFLQGKHFAGGIVGRIENKRSDSPPILQSRNQGS